MHPFDAQADAKFPLPEKGGAEYATLLRLKQSERMLTDALDAVKLALSRFDALPEQTAPVAKTRQTADKRPDRCIIPPTVEMVREYCASRKNGIDADQFVDHYTANGWQVGKTKMKDWQASIRTWERNRRQAGSDAVGVKQSVNERQTKRNLF